MKTKLFWFPLLAAFLTIGALYAIGHVFHIPLLSGTVYKDSSSEIFSAEASLIPVILGIGVGLITERIVKRKNRLH